MIPVVIPSLSKSARQDPAQAPVQTPAQSPAQAPRQESGPAQGTTTSVEVLESVSITPVTQQRTDLYAVSGEWTWEELRDYVVAKATERFGPSPRDSRKEHAVFARFVKTYGAADAERIARYAFETCGGMWRGAPVQVNRFCKASDKWFADPILAHLRDLG